jgi:hypothetical protein
MNLNDLDKKNVAAKALRESFAMEFDVSGLDRAKTRSMLNKVTRLISESKRSPEFHKSPMNPTYMKLKFMEQALTRHLPYANSPRIIIENEEVEKSQVILAAQDMVDTVQKYYEDVNDILVKELPALVDSIESEIGVNESVQFNQQVSEALTTLNSTLQETKTVLQSALGILTGQGGAEAFDSNASELGADLGAEAGADLGAEDDLDAELPPVPDIGNDERNSPLSGAGRPKR